MARPGTGQIAERAWSDKRTVAFGARLYAYGRRYRLVFGTNKQGWNRTRAESSLSRSSSRSSEANGCRRSSAQLSCRQSPVKADGGQPFGPVARKVVDAKKSHGLDKDTIADLEWKLSYLIGHFQRTPLADIDVAATDGFRDVLASRSRAIREAAANGKPLIETAASRTGERYRRRKRALSNTSINGMLALLSQILQRAVDYGHIDRNPLRVGTRKDRYLPAVKPPRTFLEVDELHALLDAASELDAAARQDRRIGRRASLATFALCGLRTQSYATCAVAKSILPARA